MTSEDSGREVGHSTERGRHRERREHRGERDDRARERKQHRDRDGDGYLDERKRRHEASHRRGREEEGEKSDRRDRRDRRDKEERASDTDDRRRSRSPDTRRHRRDDDGERSERRRERGDDGERRHRRWRDESGEGRDRHERRERRDRSDGKSRDKSPQPIKQRGPLPDQADSFALVQQGGSGEDAPVVPPKEKPNYGNTGALAAASNAVVQADGSAIVLKYHEPPEARKPPPREQWKLFVFKDGAIVDTVDLGARSCWLVGREPAVVDLLAAHPSISKQHCVVQFRHVEKRNEFGDRVGRVKPYLLDLASANGTSLNHDPVPPQRYIELRDKDLVQLGQSTREYVVMLGRD